MKIETHDDSEKQAQILKLLQFGTVMVFVDSRREGVIVPDHLKNDYQLRLNFDYAYEVDDFRVLPDRLEASLSFNRKNFFCVIPFDAVYLIVSHNIKHGGLFAQSVPLEMLEYFAAEAQKEEQDRMKKESSIHLKVVDAGGKLGEKKAAASSKGGNQPKVENKTPAKRPSLRIVK